MIFIFFRLLFIYAQSGLCLRSGILSIPDSILTELMATPGGPRPGSFPPNYNPSALASNMQNLHIDQTNQQQSTSVGGSVPRPNTSPFGQQPPPFMGTQSRPPPPGVFPRGNMPPNAPTQTTLPPNMVPARAAGQSPVSQPPPFASRPPPPGALPSSIGGPAGPPHPGNGPRSGTFSSSLLTSGPSAPPQMSVHGIGNGPPAFAPGMMQNGPRFPLTIGSMPTPSVGPPQSSPMLSSGASSRPVQMHPSFGSPPPSSSSSMGQPAPPFSAPRQNMPPPPGSLPFSAPVPGMLQSSGSPYGMQIWPSQPQQVNLQLYIVVILLSF